MLELFVLPRVFLALTARFEEPINESVGDVTVPLHVLIVLLKAIVPANVFAIVTLHVPFVVGILLGVAKVAFTKTELPAAIELPLAGAFIFISMSVLSIVTFEFDQSLYMLRVFH